MASEQANAKLISYITKHFHHSEDFIIREMDLQDGSVIIAYYSTLIDTKLLNEQLFLIEKNVFEGPHSGDSFISKTEPFYMSRISELICIGQAVVIFPEQNLFLSLALAGSNSRSPDEPDNEHVIRGPHEGFVESTDVNIALLRKRILIPDLVIKNYRVGNQKKSIVTISYIESYVDKKSLEIIESRLSDIQVDFVYSSGQVEDIIQDSVWSVFPQFLSTERPDRVTSNLLEGKVAVFTDNTPTVLIAPVTFFSFYQSPDDYNARVLVGSFYRFVRVMTFFTSVFLPGFYIAVISFHSEILPMELSRTVKQYVATIPYRPIFEALILEIVFELIREASIRLPSPIAQTIGIVGGLVIGDAIINAGLVSNMVVIVVALTAISSFVVPSFEMVSAIRILRFPFMIIAALFGFYGLVFGSLILYIHLLNTSSLKQPYLSPFIPFQPKEFLKVFLRLPHNKLRKQTESFRLNNDQKEPSK